MMKRILVGAMLALLAGCGKRQVEVRTAPAATRAPDIAIHLTNNLSQAVNVYVVTGNTDMFIRQVPPNSTEQLPVQGVAAGSNVTLKATTVDGRDTFTKPNVTLTGTYSWRVP
jgi:hypothetical protein